MHGVECDHNRLHPMLQIRRVRVKLMVSFDWNKGTLSRLRAFEQLAAAVDRFVFVRNRRPFVDMTTNNQYRES